MVLSFRPTVCLSDLFGPDQKGNLKFDEYISRRTYNGQHRFREESSKIMVTGS